LNKAVEELKKLIQTSDYWDRKNSLDQWLSKWLRKHDSSQLVLNKSTMTSEEHDFTCEHVAKLCIEKMIEEGSVAFSIEKNCYTATIWSLRNETPKESGESKKASK